MDDGGEGQEMEELMLKVQLEEGEKGQGLQDDDDSADDVLLYTDREHKKMWFTSMIVRWPRLACFLFLLIPILASVTTPFFPLQIDYGVDAFRIEDHIVAEREDAVSTARKEYWDKREELEDAAETKRSVVPDYQDGIAEHPYLPSSLSSLLYGHIDTEEEQMEEVLAEEEGMAKRSIPTLTYLKWSTHVVFATEDGSSVLQSDYLRQMMDIQTFLTTQPGYEDHCWSTSDGLCQPVESPLLFFYPDGSSSKSKALLLSQSQIDEGIRQMLVYGVYGFTSKNFTAKTPVSSTLRIQLNWGLPLPGYSTFGDRRSEQNEKSNKFVTSYIHTFSSLSTESKELKVYHGGDFITPQEVRDTFWSDSLLALGSLVLVFILLWANMGSLFLSVAGMGEIVISLPFVYFFYRVVMGVKYVGVLNGISLFIVLGVGVDDLFVFFSYFMQSQKIPDLETRLAVCYRKSAAATFLTSITTAAAFSANINSPIPALRLFGVFMGMMVFVNWLLVVTFYPAVLIVWQVHWVKFAQRWQPKWYTKMEQKLRNLRTYICFHDSNVEPKLRHLRVIERFYYQKFSPFIYRTRFAFMGIFVVILAVSVYLTFQLRPASTVPKFFPDGNNIQKFIDWDMAGFLNNDIDIPALTGCERLGEIKDKCGVCGGDGSSCGTGTGASTDTGNSQTATVTFTSSASSSSTDTTSQDTTSATSAAGTTSGGSSTTGVATTSTTSSSTTGVATTGSTTGVHTVTTTSTTTTSTSGTGTVTSTTSTSGTSTTGSSTTGSNGCDGKGGSWDQCNVCNGNNACFGCDGKPYSGKQYDQCGVCGGGDECVGCDGVPFSGKKEDDCGICGGDGKSCRGCDGVMGSKAEYDQCGVCGGGDECVGCDGVPFSGQKEDYCGVCNGNNDCVPEQEKYTKKYSSVDLVWGLKGIDRSKADPTNPFDGIKGTAIYDETFDLNDPKAQQSIADTCIVTNSRSDIVQSNTKAILVADFVAWVQSRKYMSFPLKTDITPLLYEFINSNTKWKNDVGFAFDRYGKPNRVTYIKVSFKTANVYIDLPSFEAVKEYDVWEKYVNERNKGAPESANKMFQVTDIWIRVFTETVAVSGIKQGLLISSLVSLLGLILFTGNILVALIATVVLVTNILLMLAFYDMMHWELGAIEAISITILVGLSVDYLFHIADAYCGASEEDGVKLDRFQRTRQALTEMGVSVLNGAMTSVAAGIMLVFCTIQIFAKFGIIIATNLALSVVLTLFLFSSMLMTFGPTGGNGNLLLGAKWIWKRGAKNAWIDIRAKTIDKHLPKTYRRY